MLTYLFAVLAGCANASSSVLQRKANSTEPAEDNLSFRLIMDLLRYPIWFLGILSVMAGFGLQAAALSSGPLAEVEPILIIELPITLLLAGVVFGQRLHGREWTAAAAMTAGLAGLLYFLAPAGGSSVGVRWVRLGHRDRNQPGGDRRAGGAGAPRQLDPAGGSVGGRRRLDVRADGRVHQGGDQRRQRARPGGDLHDVAALRHGRRRWVGDVPATERAQRWPAGRRPAGADRRQPGAGDLVGRAWLRGERALGVLPAAGRRRAGVVGWGVFRLSHSSLLAGGDDEDSDGDGDGDARVDEAAAAAVGPSAPQLPDPSVPTPAVAGEGSSR